MRKIEILGNNDGECTIEQMIGNIYNRLVDYALEYNILYRNQFRYKPSNQVIQKQRMEQFVMTKQQVYQKCKLKWSQITDTT